MAESNEKQSPEKPEKTSTIVELTKTVTGGNKAQKRRPREWRRIIMALSFVLVVVIPGLLGTIYYAFIASDRYVSSAGFSVRSIQGGVSMDGLGALTGLASSGTTTSDSYIILKYLKSRDLVEKLNQQLDLRALYSQDTIDPISRLHQNVPIEDVVNYWSRRISTTFDNTSSMVTFDVQAFTPQAAEKIAQAIMVQVQNLVNSLSESARQDAVKFAQSEVSRAETQLRDAMAQIRTFRDKESSIDPSASAQLDIELLGNLESRLVDLRARMAAIAGDVDENAPSMQSLKRQEKSIQQQIQKQSEGISGGMSGQAMSQLLSQYETLEVNKNFAEKSYASAMSSLEQARMDADRQQRYLAVYSQPAVAQEALFPRRGLTIIMIWLVLGAIWSIGTLIAYAVRDHLS